MPHYPNPRAYRLQAEQWHEKAEARASDKERQVCLVIADGYARLAQLIETGAVMSAGSRRDPDSDHDGQQFTIG